MLLAVVAALGSVTCLSLARRKRKAVGRLRRTRTSKVSSLLRQLRGSDVCKFVKLRGTAVVSESGAATLAVDDKQAAVLLKSTLLRKREGCELQTDGSEKWTEQTDELHSEERSVAFQLDDGSGAVDVDPTGAELMLRTAHVPLKADSEELTHLLCRRGTFTSVASVGMRERFVKEISFLPVDGRLYAVGEVQWDDETGRLKLRAPQRGCYILSARSEADVIHHENTAQLLLTCVGSALAIASVFTGQRMVKGM